MDALWSVHDQSRELVFRSAIADSFFTGSLQGGGGTFQSSNIFALWFSRRLVHGKGPEAALRWLCG